MSNGELYEGFAIIIDDTISTEYESTDKISKIIKLIEDKGIPCCKYRTLPDDNIINNLRCVNFILLDWLLLPHGIPPNTAERDIPATTRQEIIRSNLEFLKKIRSKYFAPVFIFTNQAKEDVSAKLEEIPGLYNNVDESRNFILIRNKQELINNSNLFSEIENWIKNNPTIYTLKVWEASLYKAKDSAFWHLFNRSPIWPRILWKSFSTDLINENSNMSEAIYRLVKSRMPLIEFDRGLIDTSSEDGLDIAEIKAVIKGVMYLDKDKIPEDDLQPGDIFKIGGDYYLNIRPACDTVLNRKNCDKEFYAIKGSPREISDRYDKDLKLIINRVDEEIIYGIDNKDFLSFSFKKVYKYKFDDYKDRRRARLLPPYINQVQLRYAHYASRVGLPRLPEEILSAAIGASHSS